jgi:hypothetical protein
MDQDMSIAFLCQSVPKPDEPRGTFQRTLGDAGQ